jgi:hypothetical protein
MRCCPRLLVGWRIQKLHPTNESGSSDQEWAPLQVTPAAASPSRSQLQLTKVNVTASRHNLPVKLTLADDLGNFITTVGQLTGTAPMTLRTRQRTSRSIRSAQPLDLGELDIVPEGQDAGYGLVGGAGSPEATWASPMTAVRFVADGGAAAVLSWNTTLLAAGVHDVAVRIGAIPVAPVATNITVAPAATNATTSRLLGPETKDAHGTIAGVPLQLRLRPADSWQNAATGGTTVVAAPLVDAFIVNWAPGLAMGSFPDVSSLPADSGSHGVASTLPLGAHLALFSHVCCVRAP